MKKITLLSAVLLGALLLAPQASAEGWYADVFAGFNDTDDTSFAIDLGTIDTTFDSGELFGVAIGYGYGAWRAEAEVAFRSADVDTHDLNAGGVLDGSVGELSSRSLMLNGIYEFRSEQKVSPYVGAGIGTSQVDFDQFGVDAIPDVLNDDDRVFSYQLKAGVDISINDRLSVLIDGRYFDASDPSLTTSAATGDTATDASYQSIDYAVGLRFTF